MYDMENSVMNRDFKGQNPYAAAMNAAYGFSGKYDEKDFQLPPAIMSMHNGPAAAAAAAAFYSSRMPVPAAYSKPMWRKGKWLDEEEAYTKKLIEAFNNGYLNISSGTTLRSFLSERLSCDPMRITKKFAGSSCIGKQVYTPCDLKTVDHTVIAKIQDELKELEDKFRAKVDVQRALDYYPMGAPAAAFTPIHPAAFHAPRMAYLEGIPPEYYATLPGQGPLPHMMANPFLMKMYGGQDMQMPFMYQTHPQTAKYSPSYHPIDVNQEYRADNANIPVVPIANLKSKSSRSSDEVKSNESNKKAKTEKKPKTTTQPKPSSESNAKGNGIPGDLDASDLLLNFFKAANETSSKSRSNSCEGFETAKFDEKTKDSAASISSSTLTSASNLVGMISSASSEADNEEDISDAPEEEEDNNEPTSLLAKRDSRDDYDQYETLGNNSNPAKRIRQSDV